MGSSETTVIILVTVIHVVAFAVMLWIRFRRSDPRTGRSHSTDMTHYQPLCAAHASARQQVIHT